MTRLDQIRCQRVAERRWAGGHTVEGHGERAAVHVQPQPYHIPLTHAAAGAVRFPGAVVTPSLGLPPPALLPPPRPLAVLLAVRQPSVKAVQHPARLGLEGVGVLRIERLAHHAEESARGPLRADFEVRRVDSSDHLRS